MRPNLENLSKKTIDCDGPQPQGEAWLSSEKVKIKPFYSKEDLKDISHLSYVAGLPPFLRGPYSTMYLNRTWTVRQYAGFSTAEASNAFYKKNLEEGQAFRGY